MLRVQRTTQRISPVKVPIRVTNATEPAKLVSALIARLEDDELMNTLSLSKPNLRVKLELKG